MRGRKPDEFALEPEDETFLRELLRDGHTPLKVARRAQILLNRNDIQQRVVRWNGHTSQYVFWPSLALLSLHRHSLEEETNPALT
jgi:hypothetical protein